MRILFLGDVFGSGGVEYLKKKLRTFADENKVDYIICNAENADGSSGVTPESADALLECGCDVLTGGNHTFGKKQFAEYISERDDVLRPANYPAGTPGYGYNIGKTQDGARILTVSLMGTYEMKPQLECPFGTVDRIFEHEKGNYDLFVIDIHAESTSEKAAMAYHVAGGCGAVIGTHTHVQTADARLIDKIGFMTDAGMCGPENSILGVVPDIVVRHFITKLPVRFETAPGACRANGAIVEFEDLSRCSGIRPVSF